ncbi:alanine--tRNA ligase [Candidatus Deianiraea vastatrix]|uniref:Alanine--tRNA ligase n=1 Tax=Candidatus Deianiraea vastatrix TaxID=2163644 RepID=A0A5B8XDU7_9RICK|nr:alanine--tRNA ligase [Candidatus Deianiraea vastatrix]QED23482.1 Alanine--tRNA ligase [Candidatus Deianiraea vastatrix]
MNKYQDLRDLFTNYFVALGHKSVESSSLIPHKDPSLLFVNSGMVQFKDIFLGKEEPKFATATTVQKSLRAGGKHNDLDNVGYTARHHTFFEMLGNFSFGNYFKENAIEYAWNFLTKEVNLDKNRLYITVYHTDDEAFNIWKKLTGFSDEKIIKISTNDNFWSMGDTGPCGPCSEIYYDYGDSVKGGLPGSEDQDGDRFVEIWNLVFMQFNQEKGKPLEKLAKPCIDTGMGLERLVSVLEGKTNNYDTSLFSQLISNSREILSDKNEENLVAHRVVADHLRATSFLISDGILPSNEGRGYVLRRIMRRAMRYLHQINPNESKMHELFDKLQDLMGRQYPELSKNSELIKNTIKLEENGFRETLARGMKMILDEFKVGSINEISSQKNPIISGDFAFKLYDTYGFPFDMTADIMKRVGGVVDEKGFENAMLEQKNRSKGTFGGHGDQKESQIWLEIAKKLDSTCVLEDMNQVSRMTDDVLKSRVLAIVKNGENVDFIGKNQSMSSDEIWILLDKTCFYAESGGQCSDIGYISSNDEKTAIIDVQKVAGKLVIHKLKSANFDIKVSNEYEISVSKTHRENTAKNHTATHILQAALKSILGQTVSQKGSEVTSEKLRFDFNFSRQLSSDETGKIEAFINDIISQNLSVESVVDKKENIEKHNAIANFGEKYGDEVRIVKIGENGIASSELCGGIHVKNTASIGFFKIISERSVGSGLRRIEAITGNFAMSYLCEKSKLLSDVQAKLSCNEDEIISKIQDLVSNFAKCQKEIENLKTINAINTTVFQEIKSKDGKIINIAKFENLNAMAKNIMFALGDKAKENSVLIGYFSENNSKILAVFSKNAKSACELICEVTEKLDGKKSGGGTEKFAMGKIDAEFNILHSFFWHKD